MKFSCVCTISLDFRVPMGNRFWCYFREIFTSLALRNSKKEYYIVKIFMGQGFVRLKLPLDFVSLIQAFFLR